MINFVVLWILILLKRRRITGKLDFVGFIIHHLKKRKMGWGGGEWVLMVIYILSI